MSTPAHNPWWAWLAPLAALAILASASLLQGPLASALQAGMLIAAVFVSVHHAEVIAHRIGEPFGTLVLAVAVTIIEVALIVSIMIPAGAAKAGLARDTVFAAIMLASNGIVGLCLLIGGMRHREQSFRQEGASAAMAVLCALSVLTLIMPNYLTSTPGPTLSQSQLMFAGLASLTLYLGYVFIQTVRHRDYFLADSDQTDAHAARPDNATTGASLALLMLALIAVVGLAKALSPALEQFVVSHGAPASVVGIIIAMLVLLPECIAALRAAKANRLQNSLNLALGSALASIGLTIPTVALVSITLQHPIDLGLAPKESILLWLSLLLGVITLSTGRTTILQGMIHLTVFAAFVFLAIVP